jgi:creatinine amidohydrolase/Fe(II)-dependent formamide hydrolase-like protein
VGLPGMESRVPTSPAHQCPCRGPTLLAFAWVSAFGRQVGKAPVLLEKSASVLEVHLIEVVSIEHGRFLFTIALGIPTVVLQRCFRSLGARGRQKVSTLVFHGGFLCSGTRCRVPLVSSA